MHWSHWLFDVLPRLLMLAATFLSTPDAHDVWPRVLILAAIVLTPLWEEE